MHRYRLLIEWDDGYSFLPHWVHDRGSLSIVSIALFIVDNTE